MTNFPIEIIVGALMSSPSSAALKLLKNKYPVYHKYILLDDIITGTIVLRNSDIVYDYVNRLPENKESIVLLYSPCAFKPYEFIDMLNYEGLCYHSDTIYMT